MLSVSEAYQRIVAVFHPVGMEYLALERSSGRVLSEDILAATDLPLFDNSSVDGFALYSSDFTVVPQIFPVSADIRAGDSVTSPLSTGTCARIMTGASLPPGADAVVMVEDTNFNDRRPGSPAPPTVMVNKLVQRWENIRHCGDDLKKGDRVLKAGIRLRAQEIGLLAMLGLDPVPVFCRPRLALLSSGDELLPPAAPLQPGKIHDANTLVLAALVERLGVEVISLGIAKDNEADVHSRLMQAVETGADVILSSAGVSVGAFDYIKSVLETTGELDFWHVNMRPGKPLAFGKFHDIPFFGLPGNPVSAFIGFKIFVRPALECLSGIDMERSSSIRTRPFYSARLTEPLESDGRESYLRAVVRQEHGHLIARLAGHQGSGNIFSLVQANALLIVPSGVKCVPENSEVEIWPLE